MLAVHLHFYISWKQCPCRGGSDTFFVAEGECSAQAVDAVYLKVMQYVVTEDAVPMRVDAVIRKWLQCDLLRP